METRISAARTADIQTQTSAPRATPTDQTGTRFADVVAKTAVKGAEQAATMIPGAPVMAVALRSGFQSVPMPSRLNGATSMGAPALGGGVAGGDGRGVVSRAGPGDEPLLPVDPGAGERAEPLVYDALQRPQGRARHRQDAQRHHPLSRDARRPAGPATPRRESRPERRQAR